MIAGETPVSVAEAQAFLRIDTGDEEALLAGLIRTATGLCETFTGQWLLTRPFVQSIEPNGRWQRLGGMPVRHISQVQSVAANGTLSPLPTGSYDTDIDSLGQGWVRLSQPIGTSRVQVEGTAGLALDRNGVPEPIRQGILRLTAHLFNERDGVGAEPPAAVTALWRPFRQVRLG